MAVPGTAGQAGARAGIVTGVAEGTLCWGGGKHRVQFRTGTSSYELVLSGRNNGQIQLGNCLAGRLLGRKLACELKPGSTMFLRQRQTPRWDVPTRARLTRCRHKPFSSTLLEVRQWIWGMALSDEEPPSWAQGQSCG